MITFLDTKSIAFSMQSFGGETWRKESTWKT